jgi:hypothetical protein
MKRLLVLIVLLLGCAYGQAFQLVTVKGEDVSPYCSGAVVEGRGITAGHCVQGKKPSDTLYIRDVQHNLYTATLVSSCLEWPGCDHAVLSGAFTSLLPSLKQAETLELDEVIGYTGSPGGLGLFSFTGRYLGLIWDDKQNQHRGGLMLFEINTWKGASGSIFVNTKGEAVAILVGVYPAGEFSVAFGVVLPR